MSPVEQALSLDFRRAVVLVRNRKADEENDDKERKTYRWMVPQGGLDGSSRTILRRSLHLWALFGKI
jgi:hypothetical protein